LSIAQRHPEQQVVFFAIGFETTTPPTAVAVKEAQRLGLKNFTVFCNHVLTPAAMAGILDVPAAEAIHVDGFIGPGHVSTVIGSRPFERFARDYGYPVVITGFEPLDILQAIRQLIRQLNEGRAELENEYSRVVSYDGNQKAQALMAEVFELRDEFEWRGLGSLSHSALKLRAAFAEYDAEATFAIAQGAIPDHKACECASVLRGAKRPEQCKVFATVCTPDNPLGSCMVSSEGACAAHYRYGRFADRAMDQATN
jgi:hydrogenase expression/formation protein HypD